MDDAVPDNTFDDTTVDDFLGGALRLRQPAKGVRAGTDGVFLGASVPGDAFGEVTVLDAGAGTGIAALCLARRCAAVQVDALEIQPGLAALARDNARANGLDARIRVVEGDLAAPPAPVTPNSYAVVMSNPPYFGRSVSVSPDESRKTARHEGDMDVTAWVRACLRMTKPRGMLYLVYRADRLDVVLSALQGRAGDIAVYPLWPRLDVPAKIVIIRARKGGRGPLVLCPGLVLHGPDGHYTEPADAILRRGAALKF